MDPGDLRGGVVIEFVAQRFLVGQRGDESPRGGEPLLFAERPKLAQGGLAAAGCPAQHLPDLGVAGTQVGQVAGHEHDGPVGVWLSDHCLERLPLGDGDRQVVAGQRDVPDRGEYRLLVADRGEDRGLAHPGALGDLVDGGRAVSLGEKQLTRRVEHHLPRRGGLLVT